MTPAAPVLHTFDPQIAGFVGAYIDPPASFDQVIWYSSHAAAGPWTEIDVEWPSTAIGADGLALVMHAGPPGATVYFECKLHDSTGHGALCAPIAAVVSAGPPAPTAPSSPTGVGAVAGDGQATIYWTAGPSGGSPLTGYTVTPYAAGTPGTPVNVSASLASATITGLTDGDAYTFTVKATNSVGTSAESSPSAPVTPAAPLTDEQLANEALGLTLATGDQLAYYPSPAVIRTVNADGSIS